MTVSDGGPRLTAEIRRASVDSGNLMIAILGFWESDDDDALPGLLAQLATQQELMMIE